MEEVKKINTDTIDSNAGLESFFYSLRMAFPITDGFNSNQEIDAYFEASILLFNNLKKPYWRGNEKGTINYDNYFRSKMDITFANDIGQAITQLVKLWIDKNTNSLNYNLSGLEVLIRESMHEFDIETIKMVVSVFKPIIERAELTLNENRGNC